MEGCLSTCRYKFRTRCGNAKMHKKFNFKPKNNENEREISILGAFQSISIQNLCVRAGTSAHRINHVL